MSVLLLVSGAANETAVDMFRASPCSTLIAQASPANQMNWESILPSVDFWNFFTNRSNLQHDVLMVDADMHSWELLYNQIVGLQKSGSKLAENVYVIAYDGSTCLHLQQKGIQCYYNLDWNNRLIGMYKRQTGQYAQLLHAVMMGRMMTTAVALCEGHNVFLSDTDVVFYRDPLQYAFHEANIMITATPIHPNIKYWGGTFFSDQPTQFYTLNNGVVFYRSNAVTNAFALTLAADCVNSLKDHHDDQQGFLQKEFNKYMFINNLTMHPSSKVSDPVTYRLNSSHISNTVGECYDCYFGHFPWHSNVTHPPAVPGQHRSVLKIGVFPLKRYTSFCWAPTGQQLKTSVFKCHCQ